MVKSTTCHCGQSCSISFSYCPNCESQLDVTPSSVMEPSSDTPLSPERKYSREDLRNLPLVHSDCIKRALRGDAQSQFELAMDFLLGDNGLPPFPDRGIYWLSKSANSGHPIAVYHLGVCYMDGIGTKKDEEKGFLFVKRAAELGEVQAMVDMAQYALTATFMEVDNELAVKYLTTAAHAGSREACNGLGLLHVGGQGVKKNPDLAFYWIQLAADMGLPEGYANLAWLYDKGIGTETNANKANEMYFVAAELGEPIAQFHLGKRYLNGHTGLKIDVVKAREYLQAAAGNGHDEAMVILASMYESGTGGPKDDDRAVEWLKRAARQGNSAAKKSLSARGISEYPQQEHEKTKEQEVCTETNVSGSSTM